MKICVAIPTFFRPYGLRRVLQSIKDTSAFDDVPGLEVIASVVYEQDDTEAPAIIKSYVAIPAPCAIPRNGTSYCWNTAMAAAPDADAYFLGSDDLFFMLGCWTEAVKQVQAGYGFVGFNDNDIRELRVNKETCKVMRNPDYVCHYLMTREFIIKYHGGVMCIPHYDGWWLDVEACDRAKRAGQFIHALDANIKHDWKGAAGHGGHYEKNKKIYQERKAAGFPDDFTPVIQ
jgi:hypothetical protein